MLKPELKVSLEKVIAFNAALLASAVVQVYIVDLRTALHWGNKTMTIMKAISIVLLSSVIFLIDAIL